MNTVEIIGILFILMAIWMAFEIWRAPLYREVEDGKWIEISPTKKLSNLFKKKKK